MLLWKEIFPLLLVSKEIVLGKRKEKEREGKEKRKKESMNNWKSKLGGRIRFA